MLNRTTFVQLAFSHKVGLVGLFGCFVIAEKNNFAIIVSVYTLWLCNYVVRNKMNNRALIAVPIISAAEVSYLTTPLAGIGLLALCYAVWRRHGQPA